MRHEQWWPRLPWLPWRRRTHGKARAQQRHARQQRSMDNPVSANIVEAIRPPHPPPSLKKKRRKGIAKNEKSHGGSLTCSQRSAQGRRAPRCQRSGPRCQAALSAPAKGKTLKHPWLNGLDSPHTRTPHAPRGPSACAAKQITPHGGGGGWWWWWWWWCPPFIRYVRLRTRVRLSK